MPAAAGFTFAPASLAFPNLSRSRSGIPLGFVAETGTFTRYFAEGAVNSFFDTSIALLNPSSRPAHITLEMLRSDGDVISHTVTLGPRRRATVNPKTQAGLSDAAFSTVVTSDVPVVVDRTMRWDSRGYGSHAETSVATPATTWYLAEGATHSGFDLFYLLQNATDTNALVEITYLRPAPAPPVIKQYTVEAHRRYNVWVNREGDDLSATDVSAIVTVTNQVPIIVERAMYLGRPGEPFSAGHASAGVTSPAPEWFLAEGATGALFDEFVLIANPNDQDVTVDVKYLLPGGATVDRVYSVAGLSRRTIWVDLDPPLADTAVSAIVRARDGAGIIVERTMWFPGPSSSDWIEAHNSPGTTVSGTTWALAEGEAGRSTSTDTYILIANTSNEAGEARVTLFFDDGTLPVEGTMNLAPNSRTTIDVANDPIFGATFTGLPPQTSKRFGALIESLDVGVSIVVERAMYTTVEGVTWAAGTDALGTRLR